MKGTSSRLSLHAALWLSGFAALVYESSWTRMLHRVFGVGDLAIATVLAAFFLGLGIGSWVASLRAKSIRRPAYVYAILEIIIALTAAVSPWVVPLAARAYVAVGPDASTGALTLWRLALALLILLPPTVLMGATLPILAELVRDRAEWARGVTGLYVSNTLGAVLGAGCAGLWLIPQLGGRASTWIAAVASLAAAAIVFFFNRRVRLDGGENKTDSEKAPKPDPKAPAPRPVAPVASAHLAVAFAAGTGMASLAGEVLWTRVLRIVLHATTQAFAAMLVCYLLGIALGALIARRVVRSRLGAAGGLGVTQVLAAILTAFAMVCVPHLTRLVPLIRGELVFAPHRPLTILILSGALLLPLALVLGTGLPLAWSLAEKTDGSAGRGTGKLLAANTIGGLCGSLVAGFVMVPAIGVEASLMAVIFVHLLVAGFALRAASVERSLAPPFRAFALTGPLALGVVILLLRPSIELPFLLSADRDAVRAVVEGPSEHWRESLVFLEEGRSSTVTVTRASNGLGLQNDGRPESGYGLSPPGFGIELALLASIPALFGERTERAMAIGFGGGHTTTVLLGGGYERVDVVELEEAVIAGARVMHETFEAPFPLDDPRTHLIVDDARNRLALAEAGSYDAIVSQPSHPWLAGSSALYTNEFFEEVDAALADGGVFALWINLFRIEVRHLQAVLRTLQEVFAYVQGFIGESTSLILCATQHEPRWDAQLEQRIERFESSYLEPFGLADRPTLARTLELDPAAAVAFAEGAPLIVDDRPLLEFELARTPMTRRVTTLDVDRAVADAPWWSGSFSQSYEGNRADAFVLRAATVVDRPIALARLAASLADADLNPSDRAWVEGAVAEARGDVRGALTAWDASRSPEAQRRADLLRFVEGMPRTALRRAGARDVDPSAAETLLRAALVVDEPWAMRRAVAVARRVNAGEDSALLAYVSRELEAPCASWTERSDEVALLGRRYGEVALSAQRCAFLAQDRSSTQQLGTLAVRARRAAADTAWQLGERCRVGGNGGCALLMFRRARRVYPSNSRSAVGLAHLLVAAGQRDEARDVIMEALRHVEGIQSSEQRLAQAAEQLELDIGRTATPTGSPTSTAPTSTPPTSTPNN